MFNKQRKSMNNQSYWSYLREYVSTTTNSATATTMMTVTPTTTMVGLTLQQFDEGMVQMARSYASSESVP